MSGTRRQHSEGGAPHRWSSYFAPNRLRRCRLPLPWSPLLIPLAIESPPALRYPTDRGPSTFPLRFFVSVLAVLRPSRSSPARLRGHHGHQQLMQGKEGEAHETGTQTDGDQRDRKRRYRDLVEGEEDGYDWRWRRPSSLSVERTADGRHEYESDRSSHICRVASFYSRSDLHLPLSGAARAYGRSGRKVDSFEVGK